MRHLYKFGLSMGIVIQALTGFTAQAVNDTVELDGITYFYNINYKPVATVQSGSHASGDIVIPSAITIGGVEYAVQAIDEQAFYKNTLITSATISEGVTTIGDQAFLSCTSLSTVTFPESLLTIGHGTFDGCTNLTRADLPSKLETIGRWAFNETALESVVFPPSVTSVQDYAFAHTAIETVELPATITELKEGAFKNCQNLRKAVIATSQLPNIAFEKCYALEEIELQDGVRLLGTSCFLGCTNVTSIHIPSSVTTIQADALASTGLRELFIPPTVVSMSSQVVWGCDFLEKMAYPSNLSSPTVGQYAKSDPVFVAYSKDTSLIEDGYIFDKGKTRLYYVPLSASGEYVIPSTVTSVEKGAFAGCSEITKLTVPGSVATINQGAFKGCSGLNTVALEYAANNISIYPLRNQVSAFMETSIENLILDRGISSVNIMVFQNNETLKNVTIGKNITVLNPCLRTCPGIEKLSIPSNVGEIMAVALDLPNLKELVLEECADPLIFPQLALDQSSLSYFGMGRPIQTAIPEYFFKNKTLQRVDISGYVKEIPKLFFANQTQLTEATLGEGVETIGEGAFSYTSLSAIQFPTSLSSIGLRAFVDVPLKSLEFPEQDLLIGGTAFHNCKELKTLYLPSRVKLEDFCFESSGLETVVVEEGVTELPYATFRNCTDLVDLTLPSTLRQLPLAFGGCTSLTSVRLPEGLTEISPEAFRECSALSDINFPSSLTSIGDYAFNNCSSLTSLPLNPNLASIGDYAFYGCKGLTEIVLPSELSAIEPHTFSGCDNLKKIAYPDRLSNFPKALYSIPYSGNLIVGDDECYYNEGKGLLVYAPLTLQGNVEIESAEIGAYAFAGCAGIESVRIGDKTSVVGPHAFEDCTSVASVELGKNLTDIREYAFCGCSSLEYLNVPGTVSYMGRYILDKCESLTGFTVPAEAHYEGLPGSNILKFQKGVFVVDEVTRTSVKLIYYDRNTSLNITFVDKNGTVVKPAIMVDGKPETLSFSHSYVIDDLPAETCLDIAKLIVNVPAIFFDIPNVQTDDRCTVNYKVYCDKLIATIDLYLEDVEKADESFYYNAMLALRIDGKTTWHNVYPNRLNEIPLPFYNKSFSVETYVAGEIYVKEDCYGFGTDVVTLKVPMPEFGAPTATPTSTSSVRLSANTNFYNGSENVGFEWRRIDAPDLIESNYAYCTTVEGRMVGSLRGIDGNVYYKFRPFFRYGDGKDYIYGEWTGFYTGDADVYFEPEMENLPVETVGESDAVVQGMALEGTDEIESQGIEYRPTSASAATRSDGPADSDWISVPADGVLMTVNLQDLLPGTDYEYRAYAVTASGTYYSEPSGFRTSGENPNQTAVEEVEGIDLVIKAGQTADGDVWVMASVPETNLQVSLHSVNGELIFNDHIVAGTGRNELGLRLNPGLYVLRVSTADNAYVAKLLVK